MVQMVACTASPEMEANASRYDTESDSVEVAFDLKDTSKAKYAGGSTNTYGEITFVPAKSETVLILKPNIMQAVPNELDDFFFTDCY